MTNSKKIGIYAGTFDPIHEGHLAFAHEALEQGGLDKVFFLVEPRPRRKQGVRALEHRLKMTQLAIEAEPKFGSISLESSQFTVTDTLPILKARFKGEELYFLMGDDVLGHLTEWPHVEELIEACSFIIGARDQTSQEVADLVMRISKMRGITFRYSIFQAPKSQYASTRIRLSLRQGSEPKGLPPATRDYIREHRLYRSVSN